MRPTIKFKTNKETKNNVQEQKNLTEDNRSSAFYPPPEPPDLPADPSRDYVELTDDIGTPPSPESSS